MAKPQINKINYYDANYDIPVFFSWMSFPVYRNRIIVYESTTLESVYDKTIDSMSFVHTIPAYTLGNGKTYIIQCQVFDEGGNSSELSNKHYFKTYSSPRFFFVNIEDDPGIQKITSASYNAEVCYFQAESEPLNYYRFALYDSYKTLIHETSDLIHENNPITYIYKGLDTETTYYIRCYGVTKNGIPVDTGYKEVSVDYGNKQKYARLYVENDKRTGGINYRTNIHIIVPDGYDTYSYADGKINLLNKTIIYNEGFKINEDFTLKLKGTCLYRNGSILILKNQECDTIVSACVYDDGTIRYKLVSPNGIGNYSIYSEPLLISDDDCITIAIKRVNGLYDLKAFKSN